MPPEMSFEAFVDEVDREFAEITGGEDLAGVDEQLEVSVYDWLRKRFRGGSSPDEVALAIASGERAAA